MVWGGDNPPETLMGQRLSCVVVKKDRQHNCYTPAYPKKMLPTFYQTHLQKQLAPAQFILLTILLNLIQSEKQVRLERLARVFPYPITTESRRRKLQRFLDLPQLTIALLWHPLIAYWLTTYCPVGESLSIAIDRSLQGMYKSVYDRPRFGKKEPSHYIGRFYQN
jgi:hypothetical protein